MRVIIAAITAALGTVGALVATIPLTALAQSASTSSGPAWPAKPIRILIPFPPGGTSDILARLIGPKLTEAWGPQVLVDNRVGAGGNIAMELTARAPADGYTMVLTDLGNLAITPSVYTKLPFDIIRDLTPVSMVSYSPHLLTVHPSVPVKTLKELIALARAHPGKLNVPVGLGSAPHLAGLSLEQRIGAKWVYVPTKGGQASVMTLATGEGDLMFMGMLQIMPHVKSGRLKLIAVSSEKREVTLPDTPTVGETAGLEGFVTGSYQGIMGPGKLAPEIVNKVSAEVRRILALPDIKEKLASQGTTALTMSPQEMGKWIAAEKDRWASVIKISGFKIE